MRKLALVLIVLFASFSFAQSRVTVVDLGTMANSVDESGYFDFSQWSQVDSISVSFIGTGELDVDSLTVYRAAKTPSGYKVDAAVLGNFTVTLNLAAASTDIEPLFSSDATL